MTELSFFKLVWFFIRAGFALAIASIAISVITFFVLAATGISLVDGLSGL